MSVGIVDMQREVMGIALNRGFGVRPSYDMRRMCHCRYAVVDVFLNDLSRFGEVTIDLFVEDAIEAQTIYQLNALKQSFAI
jgi:hypothetical protein